jgi:hypothetical protein
MAQPPDETFDAEEAVSGGQLAYDSERADLAMSLLDHLDGVSGQRDVFVSIACEGCTVQQVAEYFELTEELVVSLYSTGNTVFEAEIERRRDAFAQDSSKAALLPFLTRPLILAILDIPGPIDDEKADRMFDAFCAASGGQLVLEAGFEPWSAASSSQSKLEQSLHAFFTGTRIQPAPEDDRRTRLPGHHRGAALPAPRGAPHRNHRRRKS